MQKLLLTTLSLLLLSGISLASDSLVYVTKIENESVVKMTLEIDGDIEIFSILVDEVELFQDLDMSVEKTIMNQRKEYYIGRKKEVEIINSANFKSVAKKYFLDCPEFDFTTFKIKEILQVSNFRVSQPSKDARYTDRISIDNIVFFICFS